MLKKFLIILLWLPCTLQAEPKICLTMIVKNEEAIIVRCLNAVKDIVDCIAICDTGSTDRTVSLIETFMQENKIPGRVYHHHWQNFGHNRTLSAQAAQEVLKELGYNLKETYLLMLDADMLLEIQPTFQRSELKEDAYLILQKSNWISYYNLRLLRASLPWKSIGVTHEYWGCERPFNRCQISTLTINDKEDGGCKADKHERDLKLLEQGLQCEPNNERYMFYYAQTLKNLQRYKEAITWFENHIAHSNWQEEIWYSKYMIGECYEALDNWNQTLSYYLEAYESNPVRAETLYKIAHHYREKGQNYLAFLFAKHGSKIPYPADQLLFVSHSIYDYKFDEELSIAAFYTPFKAEGLAAANRLLLNKKAPDEVKNLAAQNILFYLEKIKMVDFKPITFELPYVREGFYTRYFPLNPTLVKTGDGYAVICRTVNYIQVGNGNYVTLSDDNIIKTKNFFLQYDKNFNLLSHKEIVEGLPRPRAISSIQGLEDCRLVNLDDEFWFTCAICDIKQGSVAQACCKLGGSFYDDYIEVEKLIPMFTLNAIEKNWLPFKHEDSLYAIYTYNPFTIFEIDTETGIFQIAKCKDTPCDFSRFRGSAPPIEFDEGYLFMIHEVTWQERRIYTHRFVYCDKKFNIKKLSKPFIFFHHGIEYCCGMTFDHDKKNCILSIGIEDREAYICHVDIKTICHMLESLPSF
jgi:glycosyltransferase involved in cell wall biosynthesis